MLKLLSYMKSVPSNLWKICTIFRICETIVISETSCLKLVKLKIILHKIKTLKLWTENVYLRISRLKFEKTIVLFEISTVEFVNIQKFVRSKIMSNLGPKMPCLGVFWAVVLETLFPYFKTGFSN